MGEPRYSVEALPTLGLLCGWHRNFLHLYPMVGLPSEKAAPIA